VCKNDPVLQYFRNRSRHFFTDSEQIAHAGMVRQVPAPPRRPIFAEWRIPIRGREDVGAVISDGIRYAARTSPVTVLGGGYKGLRHLNPTP
jgi:hypothetical protein